LGLTALFVRPDGDVIVAGTGRMWVVDGESGEPLRSVGYGVPLTSEMGHPVTYHPDCGVLVEQQSGTEWMWVDDDTLAAGPRLRLDDSLAGGSGNWAGTADCGVIAFSRGRIVRLNADGTIRYDVATPDFMPESYGIAAPPQDISGGTVLFTNPAGWIVLHPNGEVHDTVALDQSRVGVRTLGHPTLAPDGTLFLSGSTRYVGGIPTLSAVSTGLVPGPMLWRNSGINWAHTNSYLP
jgi:hypothetical protein